MPIVARALAMWNQPELIIRTAWDLILDSLDVLTDGLIELLIGFLFLLLAPQAGPWDPARELGVAPKKATQRRKPQLVQGDPRLWKDLSGAGVGQT